MNPWWQEPLQRWSEALQFTPEVVHEPKPSRRRAGTWWREGADWCVQLEASVYARCRGLSADAAMKRALSWTLSMAARSGSEAPELTDVLKRKFTDLLQLDLPGLVRTMYDQPESSVPVPRAMEKQPGYLLWLQFTRPARDDGERASRRQAVDDVLDAYLQDDFRMWVNAPAHDASVIVFASLQSIDGDGNELSLQDAAGPIEYRQSLLARSTAQQLAELVAIDAMATCTVTISCLLQPPVAWQSALSSLLLANRARGGRGHDTNIAMFGEAPLAHLLNGLPAEQRALFLDAAATRTNRDALRLPDDLAETLRGVMAANLNVSEAARLLYLHRNTLQSRIERIKARTGYDIRNFSDAMTLSITQEIVST